jgi:hypothetical protein
VAIPSAVSLVPAHSGSTDLPSSSRVERRVAYLDIPFPCFKAQVSLAPVIDEHNLDPSNNENNGYGMPLHPTITLRDLDRCSILPRTLIAQILWVIKSSWSGLRFGIACLHTPRLESFVYLPHLRSASEIIGFSPLRMMVPPFGAQGVGHRFTHDTTVIGLFVLVTIRKGPDTRLPIILQLRLLFYNSFQCSLNHFACNSDRHHMHNKETCKH